MPGRYKSLTYCKKHPDIPSMPHRNICHDCYLEAQREITKRKKYYLTNKKKHKSEYSDYGFMFRKTI